jgi:BON domain
LGETVRAGCISFDAVTDHREGVPMRADEEKYKARGRNLEEAAQAALRKSGDTGLSDVRCEYRESVLTLHGRVHTYYHKQLAQEIVRGLQQSVVVDNLIRVEPTGADPANGAALKKESTSLRFAARGLPAPRPNARAPGMMQ